MKKILIFLILAAVAVTWDLGASAQGRNKGDNLFYVFAEKTVKIDKKKNRYRAALTAPTDTARPALRAHSSQPLACVPPFPPYVFRGCS